MAQPAPARLEDLQAAVERLAVDDCAADADLSTMRRLGQAVRDSALDDGRPVFYRQAPLVGHFSYFQPTESTFYDKLLDKDKRGAKEFEYLNAAGVWAQLADVGLSRLVSDDAPEDPEQYAKLLYAVRKCVSGAVEVQSARYQYFTNYLRYGPAEAKLLADLAERRAEPILSAMMNDVQESLADKRIQEMVKILAKNQAERASAGARMGGASGPSADSN